MKREIVRSKATSLKDYSRVVQDSSRFGAETASLEYLRYGFFGEIGGVLSGIKKSIRDTQLVPDSDAAAEELGDALWYLIAIANVLGVDLDDLGSQCLAWLRRQFEEREKPPTKDVTFWQIDSTLGAQPKIGNKPRSELLGALASAAGVLAADGHAQVEIPAPPSLAEQYGVLLARLALVAFSFGLTLEAIAETNTKKVLSRFPGKNPSYRDLYDDAPDLPPYEKFPRSFTIRFEERITSGQTYVVQSYSGVFIGDRLTDNSNEEDGYRYHDIFHLAYVAFLGWSPVTRSLLKRKRKSSPKKDENDDGARAMIIEEGIATWIFNHAKSRNYYEGVDEQKLDYGLLKQIQSMVEGYEVDDCPLWQWERAILKGFEIFRLLLAHRGGEVKVNMLLHKLSFRPIRSAPRTKPRKKLKARISSRPRAKITLTGARVGRGSSRPAAASTGRTRERALTKPQRSKRR